MLKQGFKTINTEFIRARALSQLSVVQFRPYPIWFPGLLPLTFVSKSKKDHGDEFGPYAFVQDLR